MQDNDVVVICFKISIFALSDTTMSVMKLATFGCDLL